MYQFRVMKVTITTAMAPPTFHHVIGLPDSNGTSRMKSAINRLMISRPRNEFIRITYRVQFTMVTLMPTQPI